jgi:N-acetyl-anhydromuramyl-L-alanine amidase AmpD
MGFSKYTQRTINTPYKSSRNGTKVTTIVLHHMASTSLDGVLSMWINATRQGSANYAIGNEGQIIGAVDEDLRSWSLANAAFDSKSITFEIENEALGGSWPVSSAAHEATAKVVADICQRYGIAINRTNILGHREVYSRYGVGYSTACPGGLNMDWIVNRANQIASGTAAPTPTQETDFDMPQNWNNNGTIVTIGETFAIVWTSVTDFNYLTNMAAWGTPISKNLTGDQLTTIVNAANARGAAYAKVSASATSDPKAIADALLPGITAAIAASGGTELTAQQVSDAAELAVRKVLADAATK